VFKAYGHVNIKATHKSTFEITKEDFLTERGDCIIGIKSEKACIDLPNELRKLLKNDNTYITIEIEAEGIKDVIHAYGSNKLILTSPKSIVIRKSTYIDERTLAIKADKAAKDIKRELIDKLKNPNTQLTIRITATDTTQKNLKTNNTQK